MNTLFHTFTLKKLGAMALVFGVSLLVWTSLSGENTEKKELGIQKNPVTLSHEISEKIKNTEQTAEQENEKNDKKNKENLEEEKIKKEESNNDVLSTKELRIQEHKIQKIIQKKEAVLYEKAIHSKDVLLCDEIENSHSAGQCRNDLLFTTSVSQNSKEGCKQITDPLKKQQCLGKVQMNEIIKEKKYEKCSEIESHIFRKKCTEESSRYVLKTARTKSDCEKISDEVIQSQCTKKFFTQEDFKFSPFKCKTLPEGKEKIFCQKMTISSSLERGKKISCSVFSGDILEYCILKKSEISDQKMYDKALDSLKYTYCNAIKNNALKSECTNAVLYASVWEKKDIKLCSLIPNKKMADRCMEKQGARLNTFFYRQAKLDYNKKLCLKIHDTDLQERCIEFFE